MKKKPSFTIIAVAVIIVCYSFSKQQIDNSRISFSAKFISIENPHPDNDKKWIYHSQIKVHFSLMNNTNDTIGYYLHSCYSQQQISTDNNVIFANHDLHCSSDGIARFTIAPKSSFEGEAKFISEKTPKELKNFKFRIGYNFIFGDTLPPLIIGGDATSRQNFYAFSRKMFEAQNIIWSDTIEIK